MATRAARPHRQRSRKQAGRHPSSEKDALPRALPWPAASALVFIAAGAVLVLEILAVRLLAPYVGLTLETTTAIIGAALAGISGGAALGGYLADRTHTRKLVVGLLIAGGLLTLLTLPAVHWLGPGARGEGELAALGVTVVALVPAAAVLSAVSPAIAHLQLHNLQLSGTVVGRLSAWGTAGALVGTFGTGFVLVPLMPISTAVILVGAVLVATGLALGAWSRMMSLLGLTGVLLAVILLSAWSSSLDSPCKEETEYHCVSLTADPNNPGGYVLMLDNLSHSYVDLNDPTNLEFSYVRWIAKAFDAISPPAKPMDVVFVGGGGFTLPRWLEATRPGSRGLVLEVDRELVEFDEAHLGLRRSPSLRIETGDARISMGDVPSDSADAIVGDAFGTLAVPWNLATTEWTAEIKRVLKSGGFYALNVVDYSPFDLLQAETATLLDSFRHVRIVTFGELEHPAGGNAVLLASDRPIPAAADSEVVNKEERATTLSEQETRSFSAGSEPLRDDYAPADQLLTTQ